jgi:carboxyl-terminal processing protease
MWKWLALTAVLPVSLAQAKPLSESEYWRKTTFPVSLVAKFISNQKCNSSLEYLNSCREALKAAQKAVGVPVDADNAVEFERALSGLENSLEGLMPVQMFRARAVNAHLAYFDAHAAIKPSLMFEETLTGANQNYVGIGVVLEPNRSALVIREVAPGSPAAKAGLREDDVVKAIAKNGRDFENVANDIDRASDLILDKANTDVSLRIVRGGLEIDFPMKRAQVSVPYVTGEMRDGVGYIRINSFESGAVCRLVIKQLNAMAGAQKLILDLRGNPGGEKDMAVCVAELFLGPKRVVGTKSVANEIPALLNVMQIDTSLYGAGGMNWEGGYVARPKFTGPMVVLVDALSASGAEIVAGALQDHGRAWLIGERTSGKGTVQSEEFIPDFPSLTMKYTIERFYQPSGRTNQAVGLTPSFEVPRRKGQDPNLIPPLREIDLFPKSLAPESKPWTETRPVEALAVSRCVLAGESAEQNLNSLVASGLPADYQKAYALAVLGCM